MNLGVPPTAWKARTGELTPPGNIDFDRSNSLSDCGFIGDSRFQIFQYGIGGLSRVGNAVRNADAPIRCTTQVQTA